MLIIKGIGISKKVAIYIEYKNNPIGCAPPWQQLIIPGTRSTVRKLTINNITWIADNNPKTKDTLPKPYFFLLVFFMYDDPSK